MTSRFASNVAVLLAGAALVALDFALPLESAGWVGLGIGCFAAMVTLAAFPVRGRGGAQRGIDACVVLLAAWTIVAARVFGGSALEWIVFGSGCGFAALAFGGLVAHEVRMERYVRQALEAEADPVA